jgi:proteasome accessory factor A
MKRYFGSEIEFGLHAESPEGDVLTTSSIDDDVPNSNAQIAETWKVLAPEILEPLGVDINNYGFTSQGGRIYFDQNWSFEVATPEVSNVFDLVKYELASEDIAFKALKSMQRNGLVGMFMLNKRSTDLNRNGWGYHENISISDDSYSDRETLFMASHNVTRSFYAGAGGLIKNENGAQFYVSPRLDISSVVSSSVRVNPKPLFCDRFDVDVESFRMQQVANEATSSPWAIAVRHAMNEVAVEFVETGGRIDDLIIEDPIKAGRIVNNDLTVSSPIVLKSGKTILPTEWQRKLAIRSLEIDRETGRLSQGAKWAIGEVLDVADLVDENPYLASDRIEWVARLKYLRSIQALIPFDSSVQDKQSELFRHDFIWDSVKNGVAARKRDIEGWGWVNMPRPSRKEMRLATVNPPNDTRANIRGAFVTRDPDRVIDWFIIDSKDKKDDQYRMSVGDTKLKY